ncbi:MAG: calcium-binding protein [Ottowia sp.]|uniref:calcium-binding protein n=1 Tax=Ottowia sp. TaxID=1898956 RepID=UPI0039E3A953
MNDLYLSARGWRPPSDPLVLDLDGDGIETVGITGNTPVLFDHDADGTRTGTGWVKPDDGFVVLDLNGNGVIDSGREMFGDQTLLSGLPPQIGGSPFHTDGYAALAARDLNGDGQINSADPIYSQLRVWRDLNQDGVSQANELQTLSQLGIASIGVAGTEANVDLGGGNRMPLRGSFTRNNGSTGTSGVAELSGSLLLASNNFYRDFSDDPPLSEAARALPQMGGSGWVRDLREAMSSPAGAGLLAQVQAFAAATTRDAQLAALDDLLLEWANSSGMKLDEIWTYELHQDERGNYTTGFAGGGTGRRAFVTLNPVGMVQTAGGSGSGGAGSSSGGGGGSGVSSGNDKELTPEGVQLFQRLNILEVFNGLRFLEIPPRADGLPQGAPAAGSGGSGGSGGVGDGTIRFSGPLSQPQIDLLTQSYEQLRESVYDALVLQTRLSPYLDAIQLVVDESGIRFDTTQLTALLDQAQSSDARNGLIDLIELNKYAQGTLRAVGFDGLGRLRQNIGSLTVTEQEALGVYQSGNKGSTGGDIYLGDASNNNFRGGAGDDILDGGEGNDVLYGEAGDDTLEGGAGADQLYGGAGADVLLGGDGNDTLSGDAGDDVLDGGAGDDTLYGGAGNDTYLFGRGDGRDTIQSDYDQTAGKLNVLRFKEGVSAADVVVTRQGSALVLSIAGTSDRVLVNNFFNEESPANAYNPIQQVVFEDGTVWDMDELASMTRGGTEGADTLTGTNGDDTLDGLGGNDTLYGRAGNDRLLGGEGNDVLYGEAGDDTLEGGAGADQLYGGAGADVLLGGDGNDTLSGDAGDDVLDGGAGDDTLYGGAGNDTYLFGRGDGRDTIQSDYDQTAGKLNVLRFKEGVSAADVVVTRQGSALVLSIAGTSDRVLVNNFFNEESPANAYNPIQQVVFEDGTVWDMDELASMTRGGTEGADTLTGTNGDDTLDGLGGNDTLYGRAGNDRLLGGEGNDVLYGEAGDDTLEGGAGADQLYGGAGADVLLGGDGNDTLSGDAGDDVLDGGAGDDTLYGGAGNDTYLFGRGDGRDTIQSDYDQTAGKLNVLRFKEGVSAADVVVTRQGSALVLSIAGTSDRVLVNNFFNEESPANAYNPIQQVVFEDGTVWDMDELASMTRGGTEGADTLTGTNGDDTLDGLGGNDTLYGRAGNDRLLGGEGNDVLYGEAGDDTLEGGAGADQLYGGAGADVLLGGDGNDTLSGDAGDDVLDGGAGDDTLYGGAGNDTYLFGRGDGRDTIQSDYDQTAGKLNVLRFKEGVSAADVVVTRQGSALVLSIAGTSDRVLVNNFFNEESPANAYNPIQQVVFEDGTVWDMDELASMTRGGTEGADTLTGTNGDDTLDGLGGNDTLYGRAGNDRLLGGEGNDVLYGEAGDDTLEGGAGADQLYGGAGADVLLGGDGNDTLSGDAGDDVLDGGAGDDTLYGGAGNDTYLFGRGDGRDTIQSDYDQTAGKLNVLRFKEGVSAADVVVTRQGSALVLSIAGTSDRVLVNNFFNEESPANAYNPIQQVVFEDGTVWDMDELASMTRGGTEGADTLTGTNGDDTLDGLGGNDTLYGRAGNDRLLGGEGNDVLYGEAGDDTLEGGAGADQLYGGAGADVLLGGDGNDTLSGDAGDDVLDGGAGDDTLYGGAGNDTYLFGRGDGRDTIQSDYDQTAGKLNVLRFKEGVSAADVVVTRQGSALVLSIAGTSDRVLVNNFFNEESPANAYNPIQQVVFEDGTVWDMDELASMTRGGTEGADTLTGTNGDDTLDGLGGNDTLYGRAGNDRLLGGEGNDVLYGEAGDDTLEGGAGADQLYGGAGADVLLGGDGNDTLSGDAGDDVLDGGAGDDTLYGGAGNDTYLFGRGDGRDTIQSDYDQTAGKLNVLRFKEGVSAADVVVTRQGSALVLSIAGTSDRVLVNNFFNEESPANAYNPIQQVVFEDGTVWDMDELASMTRGGTEGADTLTGTNGDDTLDGLGGNDTLYGRAGNDRLLGGEGNDVLYGEAGDDTLEGGAGADQLYGGAGADVLLGGDGNDTLSGDAGDDVLDGGAGDDTLYGGAGNDTYLFGRGDGRDTIQSDYDQTAGKLNVLRFKEGVSAADVVVTRQGSALVLSIAGTSDRVLVNNFFNEESPANAYNPIQQVVFEDGTVWDMDELASMTRGGTEGADTLTGTNGDDTLDGLGGNDTLYGRAGNDRLLGGEGNDVLYGEAGDDTLEGGAGADQLYGGAGADVLLGGDGNDTLSGDAGDDVLDGGAGDDTLYGGAGNDTYLFGRGDGRDTIQSDYDQTAGKLNVLRFKEGVSAADVVVTRQGSALVLSIAGTSDRVLVNNFFNEESPANAYNPIQQVVFEDGTVWDMDELASMTRGGTEGADTLTGTNGDDTLDGLGGNDTLYGRAGNDRLLGGEGNDVLYGEAGDDTLEGGAGADQLYGGAGADVLLGGDGNDTLSGDAGDDVLDGGAGDDTLYGGAGNDTYLFGRGDGRDTIQSDYDQTAGKLNVLRFKEGVSAADVVVTRQGSALVLSIAGTSDRVLVNNFFNEESPANAYNPIQQVVFEDGTVWDMDELASMTRGGTEGADTLTGTNGDDTLDGLGGNDTLYGRAGNDRLLGGEGNDVLYGEAGDDTLEGGAGADQLYGGAGADVLLGGDGNDTLSGDAGDDVLDGGAGDDTLYGGAGNDTYLFGRGDGRDTIQSDYDQTAGKLNVLRFKEGVSAADVVVTRQGSALVLSIAGTSDRVLVNNFFNEESPANAYNPIQQVVFEDGTVWDMDELASMTRGGTEGADTLTGTNGDDTLDGLGGNDTLYGRAGNDRLLGGEGNDVLYGEAGDDTLEGGAGADQLYGGAGADVLLGGDGNDTLSGDAGDDVLDGGAGDDTLYGGAGNDTYLFGRGDGRDTIQSDYDQTAGKLNVLRFKEGVSAADVVVTRQGSALVLSIAGTSDRVLVNNFFNEESPANAYNPIQQVVFEDGTVWDMDELAQRAQAPKSAGLSEIISTKLLLVLADAEWTELASGQGASWSGGVEEAELLTTFEFKPLLVAGELGVEQYQGLGTQQLVQAMAMFAPEGAASQAVLAQAMAGGARRNALLESSFA